MTYGCQQYSATRLCRYDRRAEDSRCNGCQRITDEAYLRSQKLWKNGVSHNEPSMADLALYYPHIYGEFV